MHEVRGREQRARNAATWRTGSQPTVESGSAPNASHRVRPLATLTAGPPRRKAKPMVDPCVTDIVFRAASSDLAARGLLGFVRFTIADMLCIDDVTVRRSRAGKLSITYPSHDDRRGRRHP